MRRLYIFESVYGCANPLARNLRGGTASIIITTVHHRCEDSLCLRDDDKITGRLCPHPRDEKEGKLEIKTGRDRGGPTGEQNQMDVVWGPCKGTGDESHERLAYPI